MTKNTINCPFCGGLDCNELLNIEMPVRISPYQEKEFIIAMF